MHSQTAHGAVRVKTRPHGWAKPRGITATDVAKISKLLVIEGCAQQSG